MRNGLRIKDLPLGSRPRERLIDKGAAALSDAELLAIVLGIGCFDESSLELASQLLSLYGSIQGLVSCQPEELLRVRGIGNAKAAKLAASLELGKRALDGEPRKRLIISGPSDVAKTVMSRMRYLDREEFKALILSTKNEVKKIADISVGSLNSSIVHPRELYKIAIRYSGASIILVHNHPSGDPAPSREDVRLTRKLCEAGRIIGIDLIDHVIIGDGIFCSLKEKNLL